MSGSRWAIAVPFVNEIAAFRDARRPFLRKTGARARGAGTITLTTSVVDQK
jgi:hypothetical protein